MTDHIYMDGSVTARRLLYDFDVSVGMRDLSQANAYACTHSFTEHLVLCAGSVSEKWIISV